MFGFGSIDFKKAKINVGRTEAPGGFVVACNAPGQNRRTWRSASILSRSCKSVNHHRTTKALAQNRNPSFQILSEYIMLAYRVGRQRPQNLRRHL